MSNIIGLDLNLDQEYIEKSVQSIVKAAIVTALGDQGTIIKKAIDSTINCYVDSSGKKVEKGSWRARPFLDWLAEKTVEDVARECFVEIVNKNKDKLREEILEQLKQKKWQKDVAGAFMRTLLDSTEKTWLAPISITFAEPEQED